MTSDYSADILGSQLPCPRIQLQATIHLERLEKPPCGHPAANASRAIQRDRARRIVTRTFVRPPQFQQGLTCGKGAENSNSVSPVMDDGILQMGVIPNRYPIQSGSALEATNLLGPRSREMPNGPRNLAPRADEGPEKSPILDRGLACLTTHWPTTTLL